MRRDASTRLTTNPLGRPSRFARKVGPALLALCALPACGPDGDVPLRLTWRFADGRHCPDAGTSRVAVTVDDRADQTFICIDGETSGHVLQFPAAGATLRLRALTPSSAPLYRGQVDISPPIPPAITVDLHFTGGS